MASNVMKYPRYADRCRKFERTKKLICYICPKSSQNKNDTWDKHLTDPQHLLIIESFNKLFNETKYSVSCKMCSKSFAKWETVQHAITHEFSPWHKPEKLYFIFVKNFIAQIENKYYCHLCKEQFLFWHIALGHVNDPTHQLLQRDKIHEDIGDKLPINAPRCESLIGHSVFPKNSLIFECMVCDRPFGGYQNFEDHINGRGHRLREEIFVNMLKNSVTPKKQEVVIEKSVSNGKRKKRFRSKRGGSTGLRPNSSDKEKSKNSGPCQTDALPVAATSEVFAESSSNSTSNRVAAKIMTLELPSSEGSSVPEKTVFPHRQLGRVIHKPEEDKKATIPCRKCDKKVRDRNELHVHLTSHFWPRFVRYNDAEGDQWNGSTDKNILNGMGANYENVIRHQENYSSVVDATPLELDNLFQKFACIQPFSSENRRIVGGMFNGTEQINKESQTHLINPKNKHKTFTTQQVITNRLKTKEPDPSVATFKGISKLQFLENLNKQLAPVDDNTIDEPIVINKPTRLSKFQPKSFNNETLAAKYSSPMRSPQISPRKGDVQFSESNFDYIYDIDNKQLEDIKLGIILSFTRDKNNFYCMICRKNVQNSIQNLHEHLCSDNHNDYLKQMRQDHLTFSSFPDALSDLHLALQFIEETSDLYVRCWACDEAIQNDTAILKQHMAIDDHKENCKKLAEDSAKLLKPIKTRMTRNWYNVQNYWCVLCSTNHTSEYNFVRHLQSRQHDKKCRRYGVFEKIIYDFCPTCATLWVGFRCTFALHCQCKMHIYHSKDSFYHVTELPREAKNIITNRRKICDEKLRNMDQHLRVEKSKEEILVNDLLEVAQEEFYRAKVYPFGSRISGLASKNSDLDVFVDCNDTYYGGNSSKNVIQCLKAVEKSLKNRPKTWKIDTTIIENVRIPIIKTHHRPTGIECDISFTNGLTVENTQLIRNYIVMYPLCRNLIIFMKKWINACDLSGPNGLSSYAVAWMVIFYLQKKNILPSVAELIRLKGKSKMIAGWETGVEENFHVAEAQYSFIQLLQGFFSTYSQFNYQCDVICPLLGEPVKKYSFHKLHLPNEMNPYISYVFEQMRSTKLIDKFRIDAAICVQDPFDLSHNLTKSVKKFLVHRLRVFCSLSAEMVEKHS